MLQCDRPPLSRRLHDLDPPHQPILLRDPDRRLGVRQILRVWLERDDVHRAVRKRIDAHIAGVVALTRSLDKLPDQIGTGRASAGDRRADHLAWRGARRVEPQPPSVGDDAVVLRFTEPQDDRIVADGRRLWLYTPSTTPGQVIRMAIPGTGTTGPNLIGQFVERPRERYTARYVRVDSLPDGPVDVIALKPHAKDLPYSEASVC